MMLIFPTQMIDTLTNLKRGQVSIQMNSCEATMPDMTHVWEVVVAGPMTIIMAMVVVEAAIHLLMDKEQEKQKDIVMPLMEDLQTLVAVLVIAIVIVRATK
jgi:hypothetical protein